MAFKDLREFLAAVDDLGDLKVLEDADWDEEIGTITELNYAREGPALLFKSIKGHDSNYSVATCTVGTLRRALLTIGLPPDLEVTAGLNAYKEMMSGLEPVPPVTVPSGPVFENVFHGDEIDMWKFPTPKWKEHDGGRFLGTGCMVFLRDPETDKLHYGTYRVMVHDKNTLGLYITPNHFGAVILKRYWEKGLNAPIAVSFGQDPLLFVSNGAFLGVHREMSRYELAGYVRGEPVEVVREEITGYEIPASAEIVIAGEVPPPSVEAKDEGPFGEWTGYYASGTRPEPVIHVKALYHRNDPIILGMPPQKARRHFGLPTEAIIDREKLLKADIVDVLNVVRLARPGFLVVQIRQRFPGHVMKAGLAASGDYMGRFIVVVDEDIDPWDPYDVMWAIGSRCDPETALTVLKGGPSSALDPLIPPDRKKTGELTNSRVIVDACKPYHWYNEFPVTNIAGPEQRAAALEKWKDLF